MTDHPITPPPELMQRWREQAPRYRDGGVGREYWLMARAAQWGADMELEACCEWLTKYRRPTLGEDLKFVRRPKPASLKQQALNNLADAYNADGPMSFWQELDELRARVEALEAARQDKLDRLIAQDRDDESTPFQVPPPNCSQRLQREGKPYPKSDCEACGTMSPMWRQCDVALALEAVNSKPTPNPSQIRSSLVARVADAIYRNDTGDGFREEARAAIREVAAWLRVESEGHLGSGLHWSRRLEQEADR